jgi:DNA invertase Pin-like site-specific DNA recombinase
MNHAMVNTVRGYGRCSTDRQALSPLQQEKVVSEAFTLFKQVKPGWQQAVWGGFFCEEPITRTSRFRQRPMGSLLLASTMPSDVIMVSNFDRIFASLIDVCETIEIIEQRKFVITILDSDIDLSTSMGQMCFQLMAVVKNMEVKEIRRRGRETSAYRRAVGLPKGGGDPIGWRNVRVMVRGASRAHYAPDYEKRALCEELLAMREKHGGPIRQFCMWLNENKVGGRGGRKRKWNQPLVKRLVMAAKHGFPLPNGSHDPAPIPPNASPIATLTNDN